MISGHFKHYWKNRLLSYMGRFLTRLGAPLPLGVGGAQLLGDTRPLEIENRFLKKVYEMT